MTHGSGPRPIALAGLLLALALLAGCGADDPDAAAAGQPTGRSTTPSPTASNTALPPAVRDLEPCPTDADKPFELRTKGFTISGHRRGQGNRVAILSHQLRRGPCDLAALAARLATEGFRVVSWTADPWPEAKALAALVAEERRRGARSIVLVGASMGASSSLYVAGVARPAVSAVVALSPATQAVDPGDVVDAVRRYRGPILVVAGENDPSFAKVPAQLERAHDGPEQVQVIPGSSDHGTDFVAQRDTPMADRVVAFLRSATG